MQLETIRSLADWLKFGTNGPAGAVDGPGSVNALLATVLRDAGDAAPTAIASFGDETRDWQWARREISRDSLEGVPALGVVGESSEMDGEVGTVIRDGLVSVSIVYGVEEVTTEDGNQGWHYTSRAIQQSVKLWLSNANAATYRQRNSISILACDSMRLIPFYETRGDLLISGGIGLRLHVRDTAP